MRALISILAAATWIASDCAASGLADDALARAKAAYSVDLETAETAIEEALVLAPDHPEVQFHCGRIMGKLAGNSTLWALSYARKSLRCLQRAVQLRPDDVGYRRGLMAFYLGAPGIAGGDREKAWAEVGSITALDALSGLLAELHFHQETDSSDRYRARLLEGRQRFPDSAQIQLQFGLLMQQDEAFALAHEAFVAAVQSSPNPSDAAALNARYQIGRNALFSRSRLDQGIAALTAYVGMALPASGVPEREWAYLRLAQLHLLDGDPIQARRCAELASGLDDRELRRALAKLQLDSAP